MSSYKNTFVLLKTIAEYRDWKKNINGSIGFVPTLGGLHNGHISLIKKSIKSCKNTVLSIFLNPLQFSENEDLKTYPSCLDEDLKQISTLNISAVFIPNRTELVSNNPSVFVNENYLSNCLEGQKRPDFFRGVLTIVTKLFNIVSPTHAFFGEKDPQQLILIKKLCNDLNFNIKIISCPTMREKNGLAISTRNHYLSNKEQENASIIYNSLMMIKGLLNNNEKNIKTLKEKLTLSLLTCPDLKVDYISFANSNNLKEFKKNINNDLLVSVAVFIKKTRLIDSFFYKI
tara:strand:+ start:983 stop:1843 length:861 start_codon:yes stop_codon:yes gene_type:complete